MVMNVGGSDTTVMNNDNDSGVTSSEDEDDAEVASHAPVDGSAASRSIGTPSASPLSTPVGTQSASGDLPLLPPPHPSTTGSSSGEPHHGPTRRRPSLQGDFLIRCSSSQMISTAHEIGLLSGNGSSSSSSSSSRESSEGGVHHKFQLYLNKICQKFGSLVPSTSSTGSAGKKSKPLNTPGARRAQAAQAQADEAAAEGDADSRNGTPLPPVNLFPGCTPSADAEQYIAQLELSTVNVCALSRNDLTSLKRMTNAPPPVRMAIESVALVLGVKPNLVSGAASKKGGGKIKAVVSAHAVVAAQRAWFGHSLVADVRSLLHSTITGVPPRLSSRSPPSSRR